MVNNIEEVGSEKLKEEQKLINKKQKKYKQNLKKKK